MADNRSSDLFFGLKYGLTDSKYCAAGKWDPFRDWGSQNGSQSFDDQPANRNTSDWIQNQQARMNQLYGGQATGYNLAYPQMSPLTPANMKSDIANDGERWSVTLNVKYFTPEDLTVKTIGACVEVRAKHEEKQDDAGAISREFNRKYHLPEGVDPLLVESQLTYDGMLVISAPLPVTNRSPQVDGETVKLSVQRGAMA